jgi:hypothetical protein
VRAEQRGRFVHYRLGDERIAELLQLADELLAGVACEVRACSNYREPKAKLERFAFWSVGTSV